MTAFTFDLPACDECGSTDDARTDDYSGITLCLSCIEAQQDAVRAIVEAERAAQHQQHVRATVCVDGSGTRCVCDRCEGERDRAAWARMDDGFRASAMYAVRAATIALLALGVFTGAASAGDTLTYNSPASGRTLTLPYIGTPVYSDSCTITMAWEDHSAIAHCTEDGATYVFDPDGNGMAGLSYSPGQQWHAVEGGS